MSKSIKELSSEELFEMAKQRKAEEEARIQAEAKKVVDELRAQRREIVARYNKELKAIEAQINKLTGRGRKASSAGSSARTPGVSAKIVEIVNAKGEISTKEINAELQAAGIEAKNLSQTMAYLKRKGDVVSVGHGKYAPA